MGPFVTSAFNQAYTFFAVCIPAFIVPESFLTSTLKTATLVRCEAIITQLVFEHALRIRVKAEVEDGKEVKSPMPSQIPATPIAESMHESASADTAVGTGAFSSSEEATGSSSLSVNSTSSKHQKHHKDQDKKTHHPPTGPPSASNLTGRINNLVTTDLGNITNSRDVMFLLIYLPLQILLSTVFLYLILGWRCVISSLDSQR